MFGTIFYYLSSPFNIFILLANSKNIVNVITLIIISKIGLSGLTMYIYLSTKYKKGNKVILLALSSCYALMAYNVNFYFNVMWLDLVYMTPLVIMGLDRLIDNKGYLMYAITLFIAVLANFYISYMLCIFIVIYFIQQLWAKYNFKKVGKQVKRFLIISLLVGMISAIYLFPLALEMLNNSNKAMKVSEVSTKFDLIGLLMKTFLGTNSNKQGINSIYYNCYAGLIILPLLYFYFTNRNIKIKDKISSGIVILLLIFPYFIRSYNEIWHGFYFPHGFYYRFTFLLGFYCVVLAYKSYENLSNVKWWNYIIYAIVYIAIAIIVSKQNYEICPNINIIISILFTIIELVLLKLKNKQYMELLIFLIIITELIVNSFLSLYTFGFETADNFYEYTYKFRQELKEYYHDEYRFEKDVKLTSNDSLLLNYKGTSSFNSMISKTTYNFLEKIGYYQGTDYVKYGFPNIIADSILGIKTMASGFNYKYYSKIGEIEKNIDTENETKETFNYVMYENPYALKLGYLINKKHKEFNSQGENYIEYTKELLNYLTDEENDYFIEYEGIENKGTNNYTIKLNPEEVTYFVTCDDERAIICGEDIRKYNLQDTIIKYDKEQNTLTIEKINKKDFICGYYNVDLIKENLKKMSLNQLEIEDNKGGYIKGTINVPEKESTLFTTIPYEKNWKIYVDGEEKEYYKIIDTFIAIDVEEGTHIIEFKYEIKGLKIGMLISIFSLIAFVGYYMYNKKCVDNKKTKKISY